MMKPYNEEESAEVARRRAIQDIYFDNNLTPFEKHQRILAIQGTHDSDSENMSIFTTVTTEGPGVQSPKTGSVGSNSRGGGRSTTNTSVVVAAAAAGTSSRRDSNLSSKSTMTSNSKKSSASSKSATSTTSKKSSKSTNSTSMLGLGLDATTTSTQETSSLLGLGFHATTSSHEAPKPSTAAAVVAQQYGNSLSTYDADTGSERDEFQRHIVPPMDEVESLVPTDEEEGEMKDIPLDEDEAEQEVIAEEQEKSALLLNKPEELNKTRSNASKTHGSDTEPVYDSLSSMNSSIETREQNKHQQHVVKKVRNEEKTTRTVAKSLAHRKRRAFGFFFCCLLLLVVVISPMIFFFRDWFAAKIKPAEDNEEGQDDAPSTDATVETSMPTSSPTKEYFYDPPTAKDCQDIASGNMKLKEGWILRRFQVPMDVNLDYETSDVDTMAEMLVSHLQSDLAPILAGCTDVVGETFLRKRRRLDTTRFVIGNAVISAWHESDDVCATQRSTCYRVMVIMSLYVQGTKTNTPLQDIVTDALDAGEDSSLVLQLDLPSPFEDIKVRGVYPTFTTEAPTVRPTSRPTVTITSSPTTAPNPSPTANPTVQASGLPTVTPTPAPTKSPTSLPTAEPIDCKPILEQILQTKGVSQIDDNVLTWMKVDQWSCNGNEDSIVDRYALASVYLNLGGNNWLRKIQWMSAESVCDWQGVSCDSNAIVNGVDLGGNQLSGVLPTELALLTKLTSLELDMNGLGSRILPELANLVQLTSLNLADNAFTGQVPETFGNLVNLESLKLDSNQMAGGLTTQIGLMTKLQELEMSDNQLSGNIPTEIGLLSALESLNLSENKFSAIPTEISQLVSLRSLEISSNKMKGEIPELQGMAQLTLLRLDNNKLSGNIPTMPTSLVACNLTKNKFKNKNDQGVCIVK